MNEELQNLFNKYVQEVYERKNTDFIEIVDQLIEFNKYVDAYVNEQIGKWVKTLWR